MALANLAVLLQLDNSHFVNNLRDSQKEAREAEKAFKPLTTSVKDFGQAATKLGAGLTAGVTVPLTAIGIAAFSAGKAVDEGLDTIRAGTGATGAALAGLEKDFRQTLRSVPNDVNQVATAIADLNTRTGQSGEPLQQLSTQMLNMARLTGTDVQPLIASTTRVFGDWGVATKDQTSTLDLLFRASQSTGIGVDALSQKVVQFGAPLRQMGFDLTTSAALLGKFEKEGVNSELVMGSLRIALTKMAKEGVTDANQGLEILVDRIKSAGSASAANAIAVGAFGAKAGPDMAAAIREGRFEVAGLVDTLKNGTETINQAAKDTLSFSDAMNMMKNRTTEALSPLGAKIADVFQNTALPLLDKVISVTATAIDIFTRLPQPVQTGALAFAALAAAVGPALIVIGQASIGLSGLIPLGAKIWAALAGPGGVAAGASAANIALTTLSTVGVVALGAGIGILVGKLINWAIEGTRVREAMDELARKAGSWIFAGQVAKDMDTATASQQRAIATLKEHGITIDTVGKSYQQIEQEIGKHGQALAKAMQQQSATNVSTNAGKTATDALKASTIEHSAAVEAQIDKLTKVKGKKDEAAQAADKLKQELAALSQRFNDSLRPADALNAELDKLIQQGFSGHDIVKVYGDQIIDTVTKQNQLGFAVHGTIAELDAQALKMRSAKSAAEDLSKAQNDLRMAQNNLKKSLDDGKVAAHNVAVEYDAMGRRVTDLQTKIGRASLEIKDQAAFVNELNTRFGASWVIKNYGDELRNIGNRAREAGIEIDGAAGELIQMQQESERAKDRAKELQQAWDQAMANLSTRIGENLSGALLRTKDFSQSMINLAIETADGMLSAFLSGLISPFTDMLGNLGRSAAGSLGGLLNVGGLFGGGAQAVAGGVASTAGSAASTGGSIASGVGGSLLSGGVVGGAISAAGSIIASFMSRGREQRTEENTRETRDWLELQTTAWNPLFFADTINLGLIEANTRGLGDIVFSAAEGLRSGIFDAQWATTATIIDAINGKSGPLADTHMPSLAPAVDQRSITVSPQYNFDINVEAGADMTETGLQQTLIPKLKEWADKNTDQLMTKLAERTLEIAPGIVTVPR